MRPVSNATIEQKVARIFFKNKLKKMTETGLTLVEMIIVVGLVSILMFNILNLLANVEKNAGTSERRAAVSAEFNRQIAQARSLPISTLLNGGNVSTCVVNAGWTAASVQSVAENFFAAVGTGVWITRNAAAQIYAIRGTTAKAQTCTVQWRLNSGVMATSQEHYYTVEVLVTMPDALGVGTPIVMYGQVLRAFEMETRNQ